MVDWSTIDVQDLSIANGDSHELLSISLAWISVKWISLFLGFVLPVEGFLGISLKSSNFNFVGDLLIFDFPEGVELIQSLLSNWDNVLKDVP